MKRILPILLLLCSCRTTHLPMANQFPQDIQAQCYACLDDSRVGVETQLDRKVEVKYGCTVRKRNGDKFVDGLWCFQDKQLGQVGGYCQMGLIVVACEPQTGAVSWGVLLHEMTHYWLIMATGDAGHSDVFYGALSKAQASQSARK